MMRKTLRPVAALAAIALLSSVAACSKSSGGSASASSSSSSAAPAVKLAGTVTFNQQNLAKLDAALKTAMAGKSLSAVNIAMVVNVAADYWKAGQVGFLKGCSDLGISTSKCTFFAPPNGKLTEQDSELETLRSQGITGYSISAIDPASAAGTIATDVQHGIAVLAIDSPLPGTAAASLYLGTPNYTAGFQAGTAMKSVLGGKGKVAVLVGSLTASNATQRIAGFGVYSYDGPALAQAVVSAKKTATVHIVSDDSDAQTLGFIKSGVISGTVVQMPYEQGYTGAFILAAEKVLGKAATMAIIKPYLASDGSTLSSGVGLLTNSDLSTYEALEAQLGISS
jgi:ribose transport system substrate-binding protein